MNDVRPTITQVPLCLVRPAFRQEFLEDQLVLPEKFMFDRVITK